MNEEQCDLPPKGWWCTRGANHPGPCAAHVRARPIITEKRLIGYCWRKTLDDFESGARSSLQIWRNEENAGVQDVDPDKEEVALYIAEIFR